MGQTTFSGPVKSDGGFIENSFTTAERDALTPVTGLLIFNTETNSYEVYGNTGWQDAFTPPAPAAGFPYYAAMIQNGIPAISPMNPSSTSPFAFNDTGTQVMIASSGVITYYQLTTPFDIRTKGSPISVGSLNTTNPLSYAWNADGTAITCFYNNQPGLGYATISLATPYDFGSVLGTTTPMSLGGYFDTTTGVTYSADGLKLIISANNSTNQPYIYVYDLATPFDPSTASGSPSVSMNMSGAFDQIGWQGTPPSAFALNSTGTIAYYLCYTYVGMGQYVSLAEFKFAAAYDFVNIADIYSQHVDMTGLMMYTLNPGQSSITLTNTSDSHVYFGIQNMNSPYLFDSLTALTVPTISTVSPDYGVTGTPVTITGTGFTGATSVTFNGHSTAILVNTGTEIQVNAPSTGVATAVDVSVTNGAGTGTKTNAYTNPVVATTYSKTVQYDNNGIRTGDTMMNELRVDPMWWFDPNACNTFQALPVGTTITLSMNGGPSPITFTTTQLYDTMMNRYYGTYSISYYYMDQTPVDVTF